MGLYRNVSFLMSRDRVNFSALLIRMVSWTLPKCTSELLNSTLCFVSENFVKISPREIRGGWLISLAFKGFTVRFGSHATLLVNHLNALKLVVDVRPLCSFKHNHKYRTPFVFTRLTASTLFALSTYMIIRFHTLQSYMANQRNNRMNGNLSAS